MKSLTVTIIAIVFTDLYKPMTQQNMSYSDILPDEQSAKRERETSRQTEIQRGRKTGRETSVVTQFERIYSCVLRKQHKRLIRTKYYKDVQVIKNQSVDILPSVSKKRSK